MLESLNNIDWHGLYVPALPELLQTLAGEDARAGAEALDELSEIVCGDDALSAASSYVVPFLLELLADPLVGNKEGLLELLGDLARGRSDDPLYEQRVREAVILGLPLYGACLDHVSERVRLYAPYALAVPSSEAGRALLLPPEYVTVPAAQAASVLPVLAARLDAEREPAVRASLLWSMGCFIGADLGGYQPLLRIIMDNAAEPSLARLAASCALLKQADGSEELISAVMRVWQDILSRPSEVALAEKVYHLSPWIWSGLVADLGWLVCSLPAATVAQALPLCLQGLIAANYTVTLDLVSSLLTFIFDGSVFSFATGHKDLQPRALSARQHEILAALVSCEPLWQANPFLPAILRECNIPGGRAQLQACLQ